MTGKLRVLERDCALHLRRHLAGGGEASLHSAYELGRSALAADVGVLDLGAALLRAAFEVGTEPARFPGRAWSPAAVEAFVLEALSPYEMALRGAREANGALRRLEEARESEIRRLAHQLHDSAGPLLASVHMALEDLEAELEPTVRPRLARARILLVRVEEQLRRLSHELRPTALDDLGLVPAIESLADGVARRAGIRIEIVGGTGGRLPPPVELALYRIVQEGLANVVKHSHARRVVIRLECRGDRVTCAVEDDGIGLAGNGCKPGTRDSGLGLRGIHERVAALGGALSMGDADSGGAMLRVEIPLEVPHVIAGADRR